VKGTYVTVAIPFDGDGRLLKLKLPSTYYHYPKGKVVNNEVHIGYNTLRQDQDTIKKAIENDIKRLENCFRELKDIIEQYNNNLETLAKQAIAKRKSKVLADLQLVESLGIPLKKTEEAATITIPLVRKKLTVKKPEVTEKSYSPEPTIPPNDYESILNMIKHMSLVIERNPDSFINMKEPDIRNIILVLLNAVYEGTATGETFNGSGKTDILLRHEDQNLFVAECKFWKGKKQLCDAIDQLISYITWRDTKTALIVFNRNKELTKTLVNIQDTIKRHRCFKQELGKTEKTIFHYKFCRDDDKNKEFFLSVLVFEVPTK